MCRRHQHGVGRTRRAAPRCRGRSGSTPPVRPQAVGNRGSIELPVGRAPNGTPPARRRAAAAHEPACCSRPCPATGSLPWSVAGGSGHLGIVLGGWLAQGCPAGASGGAGGSPAAGSVRRRGAGGGTHHMTADAKFRGRTRRRSRRWRRPPAASGSTSLGGRPCAGQRAGRGVAQIRRRRTRRAALLAMAGEARARGGRLLGQCPRTAPPVRRAAPGPGPSAGGDGHDHHGRPDHRRRSCAGRRCGLPRAPAPGRCPGGRC